MINILLIASVSVFVGFVLGCIWVELTWDEEAEVLKISDNSQACKTV
jgi:hypothetical protein